MHSISYTNFVNGMHGFDQDAGNGLVALFCAGFAAFYLT